MVDVKAFLISGTAHKVGGLGSEAFGLRAYTGSRGLGKHPAPRQPASRMTCSLKASRKNSHCKS